MQMEYGTISLHGTGTIILTQSPAAAGHSAVLALTRLGRMQEDTVVTLPGQELFICSFLKL